MPGGGELVAPFFFLAFRRCWLLERGRGAAKVIVGRQDKSRFALGQLKSMDGPVFFNS